MAPNLTIELAGKVNRGMPAWVIQKTRGALQAQGLDIETARILVLGVAYKKNIDDMRESPAVEIIQELLELGTAVHYADPFVPKLPVMRKYDLNMASVEADDQTLNAHDAVILVTDHDCFDYDLILKSSRLLVDTRGRYASGNHPNVIDA